MKWRSRSGRNAIRRPRATCEKARVVNDPDLLDLAGAIERRCRLRGEFVLRSGMVAREYFDKYAFESDPRLLRRVADRMAPLLPAGTEVLGGLELGGVPLATMLSSVTGLPAAYVRKQ